MVYYWLLFLIFKFIQIDQKIMMLFFFFFFFAYSLGLLLPVDCGDEDMENTVPLRSG